MKTSQSQQLFREISRLGIVRVAAEQIFLIKFKIFYINVINKI
jgi:hypothetical protein